MSAIPTRAWEPADPASVDDPGALRARFERDGHLLLRGLVEPGLVADLAALVRGAVRELGFADASGRPLRGTPPFEDPDFVRLQQIAYPSRAMDALRRHPRLLAVAGALLGGPPGLGRGDVVRIRGPGAETRPHQDRHYLAGDDPFVVAWLPLEPCPLENGPLAILPGSQRLGPLPHAGPARAEEGVEPVPPGAWATGALAPGDAVIFGPLVLHRGMPTRAEVLRLSVDFRYAAGPGPLRREGGGLREAG